MKIALIHYAAPPIVGGVETVLARQAQQFARSGHQVLILAGRGESWDARIAVELIPELDSRHPQVLKIKTSLDAGVIPPDFQPLCDHIQHQLHQALEGCDVVIVHNAASLHKNLPLTAALYNLSQQERAPHFILWHHDLAWTSERYLPELHPGWPWDLLRTPWRGATQVAVSESRREELARLFNLALMDITVVPAGLDLPDFLGLFPRTAALVENLELTLMAPILLTPVRITRRKNLELALRVTAALRKNSMPQAVLVITGPPGAHNPSNLQYMEELQKLRSRLELDEAAYLLAEYLPEGLPDVSISDFYRVADAMLLPSREEGFGIPILEAGLSRMPIFCSDLPPLQALAGENATYFSLDDSPEHIAELIAARLSADPAYRLRVRVRQNYTWEAIYQRQIAPLLRDHTTWML